MRLIQAGDYEGAAELIATARQSRPAAQLIASSRIGPCFSETLHAGKYEDALKICDVWSLACPATAGPYFSKARVYKALDNTAEARRCYEKIIAIDPGGQAAERARRELE
jgi:tetratricopeptide (TPR) repeat protein